MLNSYSNISDKIQLNISQLPAAAYFISITNTSTGEVSRMKFVKY